MLVEIIFALLSLIAMPLGTYLAKFLKEQISKIKHDSLQHAAEILVRYAESRIVGDKQGSEKYTYVYKRLVEKFPWASASKINEFLEASHIAFKKEWGNGVGSAITQ